MYPVDDSGLAIRRAKVPRKLMTPNSLREKEPADYSSSKAR